MENPTGISAPRTGYALIRDLLDTEFPQRVAQVAAEYGVTTPEPLMDVRRAPKPYNLIPGPVGEISPPRGRPMSDDKRPSPLNMTLASQFDVVVADIGADAEELAQRQEIRLVALLRTFSYGNTPYAYLYRLVDYDSNQPSSNRAGDTFGQRVGVRVEVTTIEKLD